MISHNVFADAVPYPRENLMRKIKVLYGILLLSRLYVTNILKELNDSRCPDNVKALEECLYYKWLDLVYSIKIGQNVVYAKNHVVTRMSLIYLIIRLSQVQCGLTIYGKC